MQSFSRSNRLLSTLKTLHADATVIGIMHIFFSFLFQQKPGRKRRSESIYLTPNADAQAACIGVVGGNRIWRWLQTRECFWDMSSKRSARRWCWVNSNLVEPVFWLRSWCRSLVHSRSSWFIIRARQNAHVLHSVSHKFFANVAFERNAGCLLGIGKLSRFIVYFGEEKKNRRLKVVKTRPLAPPVCLTVLQFRFWCK